MSSWSTLELYRLLVIRKARGMIPLDVATRASRRRHDGCVVAQVRNRRRRRLCRCRSAPVSARVGSPRRGLAPSATRGEVTFRKVQILRRRPLPLLIPAGEEEAEPVAKKKSKRTDRKS